MFPLKIVLNSFKFFFFIVNFSKVRSEQLTFLNLAESFDTLKLLKALAENVNSTSCHEHMSELLADLNSGETWALKMYDSSAKTPSGFFTGNTINPGQYDECLDVEEPGKNFTGQHCELEFKAYYKINGSEYDLYQLINKPKDKYKAYKFLFAGIKLGLCLPSTCTGNDITQGLNSMFNESQLDEIISVTLKDEECRTKTSTLKNVDWLALLPLLGFIAIAIFSTIFDVTHQQTKTRGKSTELYSSFSLYKNGKTLFEISDSSEQLKPLHGIRVLSTFWIVILHQFGVMYISEPSINKFDTLKVYTEVQHLHIFYGFIAVDTFFFLSGMLTCIVFFRDITKKGYYDILLGYIHRYIRLTPSYAAMIYITANIYSYLGDGPYWEASADELEKCRKNWWSGILYIQNFVNPYEMCMGHSWYLSTDMQLHWISPIILCAIYFWPAFVKSIIGMTVLSTVSINFAIAYVYNLGANSLWANNSYQWDVDYNKFYMRATPYVIGLGTGYFIHKIREEKIKFKLNALQVALGWLASTGLCLATMYGSLPFAHHRNHSTLENVSYLSLHRAAWGLGLSWIVFACLNGFGGPINKILSWNIFQPFSKLTYNVYLIHIAVMTYRADTMRGNYYADDTTLVFDFLACLVITHLLAIPLTLIIEMPFGNLDKYFTKNLKLVPVPWNLSKAWQNACNT